MDKNLVVDDNADSHNLEKPLPKDPKEEGADGCSFLKEIAASFGMDYIHIPDPVAQPKTEASADDAEDPPKWMAHSQK